MRKSITIQNSRMPLVEYQGQRVVTFSMVDEAHQRPKGTAKDTFSRNRARFIEGVDFFIVAASKVNWGSSGYLARGIKHTGKKMTSPVRGRITLITESGYLLLTKPFNDDLAWQVQRQLVKAYFRHIPQFPELHKVHVPDAGELAAMPLVDAQHLIAKADQESFTQHGKKGSAAMILRREELKELRPALCLLAERSQIELPGMNYA
ncbi:ORF6N domain-containing protein [Klebsiella michiganensis]|uniref:ORF6N domain-containing protein n=1 Tax=Klebsiella michiganensis TaxID=1134687 RepID=UPI0015E52EA7|nr:ORF6N domain-containing protein [Klebsiella michiganensis]QLP49361.1 ORF6N domain-containing protein [Klebsiella michiganensis]